MVGLEGEGLVYFMLHPVCRVDSAQTLTNCPHCLPVLIVAHLICNRFLEIDEP